MVPLRSRGLLGSTLRRREFEAGSVSRRGREPGAGVECVMTGVKGIHLPLPGGKARYVEVSAYTKGGFSHLLYYTLLSIRNHYLPVFELLFVLPFALPFPVLFLLSFLSSCSSEVVSTVT